MNKKTVQVLIAGFVVTLVVAWSWLALAFARDWFQVSPSDAQAARIILPLITLVAVALIFLVIAVGVYVYRDAKRRGMEPLLWTLVALFVPYFLGLIIYLIVRQPLQSRCLSCGARTPEKASFCPACGKPMVSLCPKCQASAPNGARFCHACGVEMAQA